MGAQLLDRLATGGYSGDLVLVSARPQEINGQQTVTSARGGGGDIDHALIVVPAEGVPGALEDAAASGARVATIFSAGFGEIGEEGAELDQRLRQTIAVTGIRVLGPNCLGFINFHDKTFASTLHFQNVEAGPVSVVGQSGSVAARLAGGVAATGTGLDLLVTIGNSVDRGPADVVEYLAARESTRVIVLYLESLGAPARMLEAIKAARAAGKEVVVLKSGRTEAGARSAASHTGATASKDVFVDVLLRDAGALRVDSVQEACDVSSLLARVGRLSGRAAIVAPSGGDCTLAADRCENLGIPLATIREEAQAAMREAVPICAPSNPIDPTTMAFRDGKLSTLLEITANEPDVDFIVFLTSTTLIRPEGVAVTLPALQAAKARGAQIIVGAPVSDASRAALRESGIGLIEDSERVFNIVRRVLEPRQAEAVEGHKSDAKPQLMGELEALDTLRAAGLPMLETRRVSGEADLRAAADQLGYPLVLKGLVPNVGHKSGLGLVKLDLQGWDQLAAAYDDVRARTADYPGSTIVVQPSIKGGLAELLIGVVSDPDFGKHVTLGMGGVFTDFLRERAWARAPVSREEASRMLDQLAIAPGLRGGRAGVKAHAEGVIDALVKLSEWAVENDARVEEVEINPLIVRRDEVVGVDALVALRSGQTTAEPARTPAEASA